VFFENLNFEAVFWQWWS